MPWKETHVLDERVKFVAACEAGEESMAELCREAGVSRKTGYKIWKRYQELGLDGLKDQSRAPRRQAQETSSEMVDRIIEVRRRRPTLGPRKLRAWLLRHEPGRWPAASTIGDILKRHGLIKPRRRRRKATPSTHPLGHAHNANDLWCADFKGWFRTGDGRRCDPLTITDAFSRYLISCRVVSAQTSQEALGVFRDAFRAYGLPRAIRTDNGAPFASTGLAGLSKLSVWWIRLGITPERIEPGKPQQNGRHERFHLTLKQETAQPPRRNRRAQQAAFAYFAQDYNEERPHEALDDGVPAEFYERSHRPYPRRLPELDYPPGSTLRRVRSNGTIKWRGSTLFLSESLVRQTVALTQSHHDLWNIYFGPLQVAVLDNHTEEIIR